TNDAVLDSLGAHGINALCLERASALGEEKDSREGLATLLRAGHSRDMRVCIEVSATLGVEEYRAWTALGVDGFLTTGDPSEAAPIDAVHLRTNLFHVPDGRCYFDGRGGGDFSTFWRAFEGARRAHPDQRIAISTSDDRAQVLAAEREPDDLEVIYAF